MMEQNKDPVYQFINELYQKVQQLEENKGDKIGKGKVLFSTGRT